jgi:hypothetical protein
MFRFIVSMAIIGLFTCFAFGQTKVKPNRSNEKPMVFNVEYTETGMESAPYAITITFDKPILPRYRKAVTRKLSQIDGILNTTTGTTVHVSRNSVIYLANDDNFSEVANAVRNIIRPGRRMIMDSVTLKRKGLPDLVSKAPTLFPCSVMINTFSAKSKPKVRQ